MKTRCLVVASLSTLFFAGAAHARPLTTAPSYVLTIRVTITDSRIALNQHSAPRGVEARFVIKNTGAKVHNFTLKPPTGVQKGFSQTLKPGAQKVVRLFLDRRGPVPYVDGLPADRGKPGMRGFFDIL